MKLVTLDYYCVRMVLPGGEKQWRLKTRASTEKLLNKLLLEYPGVPTRFFMQGFTVDDNGAPSTSLKEETIQLYGGYPEDTQPQPQQNTQGAARRAEW